MAKLYFKFGAMGSSKSANCLMAKFNYEQKGKKTILLKPKCDTRSPENEVNSRIGLSSKAKSIAYDDDINVDEMKNYDVILVDEAQFFAPKQIETLKYIASILDIPVLCYGLLTNYKLTLFEGSKRLVELADSLQEIKSICDCGKKANVNCLLDKDGKVITEGNDVVIGDTEYRALCYSCYYKLLNKTKGSENI